MTINGIKEITRQELRKQSLTFEEKESLSTNSVYYTVYLTHSQMVFRISDHLTSKDMSTFRYSKKTTPQQICRYLNNRIKDAKARELSIALEIMDNRN